MADNPIDKDRLVGDTRSGNLSVVPPARSSHEGSTPQE